MRYVLEANAAIAAMNGVGSRVTFLPLSDRVGGKYESTKVWVESMTGGPFNPDAFDLPAANKAIALVGDGGESPGTARSPAGRRRW